MKFNWMKRQQFMGYVFIAPSMLGVLIFFIIPALFSLVLSFTNYQFTNPDVNFVGLDNFSQLFQDEKFYSSVKNSAIFLAAVPISIALAFILAVILNQSVYMKKLLRAMYFMPYITSGIAISFVWMLLFQPSKGPINHFLGFLGIDNPPAWFASTDTAMIAIDIIWIWFLLGYNMIIYLAALQEISPELMEATKIDGAKRFQTIRHVVMPLVSPTTFLLLITGIIMTVKTFGIIEAVTHGGPGNSTTVLSLYIYKTAFGYYEMGYASALSWILFIMILAITVFQWVFQKKWVHY